MNQVSVVIATRNRPVHLSRLLTSLQLQTFMPLEIIVVDASDDLAYAENLTKSFAGLSLKWISSQPSVCVQRNIGIQQARGYWVFVCDDDIELPADHIAHLTAYVFQHPACGVAAGMLLQKEGDNWVDQYPASHTADLLWRFVFLQSVWGDVHQMKVAWPWRPLHKALCLFYKQLGNTASLAGWPLITDWSGEVIPTRFYALGAALFRKAWLLQAPYDEVLDADGIGDNYGIAARFHGSTPIHILKSTRAYHQRAPENRLDAEQVHVRRVMALHYFQKRQGRHVGVLLGWSLLGNVILHLAKGRWKQAGANLRAILNLFPGRNVYWRRHQAS